MCMGGGLLARVCELFAKDFAHSCGGLPDLTLWNPAETSCKVESTYRALHFMFSCYAERVISGLGL